MIKKTGLSLVILLMFFSLFIPVSHANESIIYEDAEDNLIAGWNIYDKKPVGAVISNVFDDKRGNRVITVSGSGADNGYRLRKADNTPWQNNQQFVAQWRMKYSEQYIVYFKVNTTQGIFYLYYTPVNTDIVGKLEYCVSHC